MQIYDLYCKQFAAGQIADLFTLPPPGGANQLKP